MITNTQEHANTQTVLREIASTYGTPTYAFDVQQLRNQVEKLRTNLPDEVDVFYSLKSNASLGICDVLASCGIGADVASAGELATAVEAGFPASRIFIAGPFKMPETVDQLRELPDVIVSVDSLSELKWLCGERIKNRIVLRLRPDFGSCAVVKAGSDSRFGFTCEDLKQCATCLADFGMDVIGFHVFAGSQVLDSTKLNEHLRRALDLSLRAAETLRIEPSFYNLGGGFGIPYSDDEPLDLAHVCKELSQLANRAAPARLALELGRYLVAEAGWYLTSVLGHQTHQGRRAVVVDGGVHQRADLCGVNLRVRQKPPLVITSEGTDLYPTDVLGCLSLPDDVMLESARLPKLVRGDILAFPNTGAYGVWSSPAMFHGSPLPAEVAFDGESIHMMRERKPATSVLNDQFHVPSSREHQTPYARSQKQ